MRKIIEAISKKREWNSKKIFEVGVADISRENRWKLLRILVEDIKTTILAYLSKYRGEKRESCAKNGRKTDFSAVLFLVMNKELYWMDLRSRSEIMESVH